MGFSPYENARAGEMIGGGYIVFRRGTEHGRIRPTTKGKTTMLPFEHPTMESAMDEMKRLAALHVGQEFCVFEQVARCKEVRPTPTSTADLDAQDYARNFGATT